MTVLRALAAKATPGPWRWSGVTVWRPEHPDDPTDWTGNAVAHVPWPPGISEPADAAWIAACDPQTVIGLLGRAERAEAALDKAGDYIVAFGLPYDTGLVWETDYHELIDLIDSVLHPKSKEDPTHG